MGPSTAASTAISTTRVTVTSPIFHFSMSSPSVFPEPSARREAGKSGAPDIHCATAPCLSCSLGGQAAAPAVDNVCGPIAFASSRWHTGPRCEGAHGADGLYAGRVHARHSSRAAGARLDGGIRRALCLSLPAAQHRQRAWLGDPVAVRLQGAVDRAPQQGGRAGVSRQGDAGPGARPFRPWHPDVPHHLHLPHRAGLRPARPGAGQRAQGRHRAAERIIETDWAPYTSR